MTKNNKYEMDMTKGSLLPQILIYSLPLILSGILQLLFNAADLIVVGHSDEPNALAGIGATSALINFFTNLIIGVSVGSNVVVARFFGAGKEKDVHDAVHTSISVSLILGIIIGGIGIIFSGPILQYMQTPSNVINLSTLYIHIYFAGLPFMVLYNFGSAILRAIGDTRRPLIFLFIAGIINIILNIFFVKFLHMDVEGVAFATVISQAVSAFLVILCLMRTESCYKLILKDLKIDKKIFILILRVGLPAGVQGMLFSISNMLIQSSVNFFGSTAMNGNTACQNIEGFVYTSMNAVYQTALCFVSQNYGVGNYKRIKKIMFECLGLVTVVGLLMGNLAYFFGRELLSMYTSSGTSIYFGLLRMKIICTIYFLCGLMDVLVGILRGLGYGILPMIISLIGACGLRIIWIFTIFQKYHTLDVLFYSYPFTWTATALAHTICLVIIFKNIQKKTT